MMIYSVFKKIKHNIKRMLLELQLRWRTAKVNSRPKCIIHFVDILPLLEALCQWTHPVRLVKVKSPRGLFDERDLVTSERMNQPSAGTPRTPEKSAVQLINLDSFKLVERTAACPSIGYHVQKGAS